MANKVQGFVEVENEVCKACDLCLLACPRDCLKLGENVNSKGYHYVLFEDVENCIGCADCAVVCPDAVLTVFRAKIEV